LGGKLLLGHELELIVFDCGYSVDEYGMGFDVGGIVDEGGVEMAVGDGDKRACLKGPEGQNGWLSYF